MTTTDQPEPTVDFETLFASEDLQGLLEAAGATSAIKSAELVEILEAHAFDPIEVDAIIRELEARGFEVSEDGAQALIQPSRLRAIPLLAGLPEGVLEGLAEQFGTERLGEGRLVFAQGDPGDKLFVIVRGSVEVVHAPGSGPSTLLGILEDGDYFGELALLDEAPRSGTVRTRSPCLFLTLARQQFHRLLAEVPHLRADLERVAAARRASTPA